MNYNVSWDGGLTYSTKILEFMFESKVSLSDRRVEYRFIPEQYIDVLALFGGLLSSVMVGFKIMGTFVNKNVILANSIEDLYLVDYNEIDGIKANSKEDALITRAQNLGSIKLIHFSNWDKFAWIK